ncbi:hypothetical protein [Roseovarius sp. EL26]|uniref:hypothetical protein n=1 Tax=Roseovarius sp. EL26 TaxID=2126672 RepID=UPI0013C4916A|nr:hypothetical protein [Roseovarius sp. EL26]
MNIFPDPFPWTSVASTLLTVILSFGGFVIGIRAGKNNRDRGFLRDTYKSIYTHLRTLKESIALGKPMQWDSFRTEGNKYIPPVKALELDGTINALPDGLAKSLIDVEQTTLFNNWQWKKMIEDGVGPEIKSAMHDKIDGEGKSLEKRPYRQVRISSLMLLDSNQTAELAEGLETGDIGLGIEFSLQGGRTDMLHAYPETLKSGTLPDFVKEIKELSLASDEARGLADIHRTKVKEIESLMFLVAKRIKDPHPFWSSVRQALRDPFS